MSSNDLPSEVMAPASRAHIEQLQQRAASGGAELAELLALRASPKWLERREVIAALGALGNVALGSLCAALVRERGDETVVAATVDALVASTGDADARVASLVTEPDPAVLADVAQILGRRRNRDSVPILARLSQHENDNVAVAAIEGLGRLGGRAVVDVLVQAVESRRFFRTFAAIDVLAKSGDPRAIGPLVALLDTAHYSFEAARALGRTADRAAVPALAKLLSSPADTHVTLAALALHDVRQGYGERYGTTAPIEEALHRAAPSNAPRRLSQCWEGADSNEQIAILVVLGCLRSDAALPVLLGALDGSAELAAAAAQVLTWLARDTDNELVAALRSGNSSRRQVLLPTVSQRRSANAVSECLNDGDPVVRRLACESLARLGDPASVPALFAALKDNNPVVTQAATAAIIALASEGTLDLAVRAARSSAPGVRRAAMRILSCIGRSEAVSVLAQATADGDPRVRDAAIAGLGLLEGPESVDTLLELTGSSIPEVRARALRALGDTVAQSRVSAALLSALSDGDAWARYFACQALGRLRVESSVPAIVSRVSDAAGQVRVAAIEALSHLPGETAFEALRHATESDELDLRRAALIGLGLSRRPEAVSTLLSHAASDDEATRLITLSALANFESSEALRALDHAARTGTDTLRTAATGLLAQFASLEATRVLCELLSEPALRDLARAALATPRPRRVAGISSVLMRADDELALELTRLLARLDQPEATAALFEALGSGNTSARKAAVTTLGALGSRNSFAALQRLATTDPDAEVRRVAALLLSQ